MLLTLLHSGDLTLWELLTIFVAWAFMLLIFIGLPLCLIGYIFYKIAKYRKEMSDSRSH